MFKLFIIYYFYLIVNLLSYIISLLSSSCFINSST